MFICGVEIKSNQAVVIVLNNKEFIEVKTKRIELSNDEDQVSIREFCNDFLIFLKENNIEKIYIKKRAKKGNFAGGAVTFKIEALIQLNPEAQVQLISAQAISSFEKKNEIEFPNNLKKYQEQAYLAALLNS